MTRRPARRSPSFQRLVLLVALVAFVVTAAIGPLGTLCLCLGDDRVETVAVGCCCNDQELPAPADDGPTVGVDEAPCDCVDVKGVDQPAAPERRANHVPEPVLVALANTAPCLTDAAVVDAATLRVRPPPETPRAPPRHRILRV